MSQNIVVVLEDDLDGTTADETISFAIDHSTYEIDLNSQHAGELRAALAPYLAAARKTTGTRRSLRARTDGTPDSSAVRAWAARNGIEVSPRGRIAQSVFDAYASAN